MTSIAHSISALSPEQIGTVQAGTVQIRTTQVRTYQAFGIALLIEVLVVAVMAMLLAHPPRIVPKYSKPVKLVIVNEPTPPKPVVEPKPMPPVPKPKPVVRHIVHPRPIVTPQPPKPDPIPPKVATPTAFTQPVPPPPAPPLPPQPAPSVDNTAAVKASYDDKIHAAVQAAVYYPRAAAAMNFSGRVRVEFHMLNSVTSDAKVLVSSNLGMIDRAALRAVKTAAYPAPPKELRDKDLTYQVWVEFALTPP